MVTIVTAPPAIEGRALPDIDPMTGLQWTPGY